MSSASRFFVNGYGYSIRRWSSKTFESGFGLSERGFDPCHCQLIRFYFSIIACSSTAHLSNLSFVCHCPIVSPINTTAACIPSITLLVACEEHLKHCSIKAARSYVPIRTRIQHGGSCVHCSSLMNHLTKRRRVDPNCIGREAAKCYWARIGA